MSNDKITVLFTSGSGKNPYHKLLFEGLEKNGVKPIHEILPLFLPLTRTIIRNEKIDTVHLGWLYSFFIVRDFTPFQTLNTIITAGRGFWFCIDLLLVRLLGVQLVWTVHNKYHHERYYVRIEYILNIVAANVVHTLTVKCPSAKKTISEIYHVRNNSKIAVIPDGSYIDAYPNTVKKSDARKHLDIGDKFVYLYFGLIRPYKGVEELVEAFKSIESQDIELWIVGNPKTDAIRKRIISKTAKDQRIHTTLEYVPDEDIQYYMNAADVLVLPYQDILNSGSVYLGLSFGKPIIAPRIGCIPSSMSTKNTLLYNPAGTKRLKNALCAAHTVDLLEISQANFRQAKKYDWTKIGNQYYRIYSNKLSL